MAVLDQMRAAEAEIAEALAVSPSYAITRLMGAYERRNPEEKEAFVAALIGRVATTEAKETA